MGLFNDFGRLLDASGKQKRPGFSESIKQAADAAEQANRLQEAGGIAAAGMGGTPSANPFVNAAAMNAALRGSGVVKAIADTGQAFEGAKIYDVTLEVTVDGEEPFEVVHRQMIAAAALGIWQPGKVISLRVDPNDHSSVMLG